LCLAFIRFLLLALLVLSLLLAGNAWAFNPAVLYDQVDKFDKFFNEAA